MFSIITMQSISYAYLSAAYKRIFFPFFISRFLIVRKLNTVFLDSKYVFVVRCTVPDTIHIILGNCYLLLHLFIWKTRNAQKMFGQHQTTNWHSTTQIHVWKKKKEQTGNSTGTGENRCLIQTSKKKKLSFGLHKANLKTKKKHQRKMASFSHVLHK